MTRGGKREGAGRPEGTKKPEKETVKPHKISMTDNEYKNYIKNGGAKWLRGLLQ